MIYVQLFLSFLQIGAFSFGGGYAAMPLIQAQVVDIHGWLSLGEFTDLVTISQMTPGPIAINSATFVGLKTAGFWGALCATLGCIFPSCIIVSSIAWFYLRYRKMAVLQGILGSLRPAVVGLIAAAGLSILLTAFFPEGAAFSLENLKLQAAAIFALAVYLIHWKQKNPIGVMVFCGVCQILLSVAGDYL